MANDYQKGISNSIFHFISVQCTFCYCPCGLIL